MEFKLALYAHLFIHFLRQVFHLKYEISSIHWSFLKHLSKLQIGKKFFYKKSVFSVQFNLNIFMNILTLKFKPKIAQYIKYFNL